MIVAEIEFRKVAVQVLLAAMLVDALHAALEDREIVSAELVCTSPRTYSPAECGARFRAWKKLADSGVEAAFVGMEARLCGQRCRATIPRPLLVGTRQHGRCEHVAAALDQRHDRTVIARSARPSVYGRPLRCWRGRGFSVFPK